jgi:hypothetical protein
VIARPGTPFVAEKGATWHASRFGVFNLRCSLSIFDTALTSHQRSTQRRHQSAACVGQVCGNAGFFVAVTGRGSIALQKHPRLTFRSRLRGLGTDIFKRTRMTLLRAKRRDDSCPAMNWKWP